MRNSDNPGESPPSECDVASILGRGEFREAKIGQDGDEPIGALIYLSATELQILGIDPSAPILRYWIDETDSCLTFATRHQGQAEISTTSTITD